MVYGANVQDRDGGEEVLLERVGRFHRLKLIWADGGYAGEFVREAKRLFGRVIEIVKRSDLKKFVVLPKRWIVERTFSCFNKYRRLSKDCETLADRTTTGVRPTIAISVVKLALLR